MKFRKKRLRLSVLLVITSLIAGGCSSRTSYRKAEDRYVVGVVTKSNTSEYWMSVNSGMEAAAAKYDMDVITLAPDSELDREVQEKQVEKLLEQKVDALAVAPIDSDYVPEYLDDIRENKITALHLIMDFLRRSFRISVSTITRLVTGLRKNWQSN